LVSPLLYDRPVDAKHWYFQVGQHLLYVVHFPHELREDKRLLTGVLENIRDESRHLPGTTRCPQLRTFVLLDGHAVQVQLRPRHHLTHAQERLEKHHLPTGSRPHLDHLADHILPAAERLLIEHLFLREHLELDILKNARRKREACVEFGHALLGAPEHIRLSNLVGVALDHIPWDAQEAAERHKVLDGVEDGRAGHDPPDGRVESRARDVTLRLFVANLVPFIEDHAVPLDAQQWAHGATHSVWKDRIWSDHHIWKGHRKRPLGAIE
jgi:hypothetical protein